MIVLTSSGLSNPRIFDFVRNNAQKPILSACIVVTAAIPQKAESPWIKNTFDAISSEGISRVDYHDFEFDDIHELCNYDMIFLMGGNPYYLLYHAQKANAKPVLEKCHKQGKIVFGRSAAAMVLSSGVHYVEEFNQIMQFGRERGNTVGLEDFGGLRFMDYVVFPHFDDFANRVPTLAKRLIDIEQRNRILITRLKNGEGIVQLENGKEARIAN